MENENTENLSDDILTLDEILDDPYYKAEFDRRVQQALNIKSQSDLKGDKEMDENVRKSNREEENIEQSEARAESRPQTPLAATEHSAVEHTDKKQQEKSDAEKEPAREMSPEQFDLYNETLRRVSKTAKASLPSRYNAFEDAEVKTLVKRQVMQGETPSIKDIAAGVVQRLTPKESANAAVSRTDKATSTDSASEVISLKAENALLKAGIAAGRIEAAKKLFIAEGAPFGKIAEFVAQYPEWQAQEGRVVFGKAPPIASKTAPNPGGQPVLNDFERRVQEVRKARGYK